MATTTQTLLILAARYRRAPDGKITAYFQVQKNQSAPVGYIRGQHVTQALLPGTWVTATGSVKQTQQRPVLQLTSPNDIKAVSAPQMYVVQQIVASMLSRLDITFDAAKLEAACGQSSVGLPQIHAAHLVTILQQAGVTDAAAVVYEREETWAAVMSKLFLQSLEGLNIPIQIDTKRDTPFIKGTWPYDIVQGYLKQPSDAPLGKAGHTHTPMTRPARIAKLLDYDGIDNMFQAMSVLHGSNKPFMQWMADPLRGPTIAQSYVENKQQSGTQIFTSSDMQQLEKLGLLGASKLATHIGNMVTLPFNGIEEKMLPFGAYQSATVLALLQGLPSTFEALPAHSQPAPESLDVHQQAAYTAFTSGAPLLLISGPPGTGKSTTLSAMIAAAQTAGEKVVVVAPGGKAAAHLNQSFAKAFADSSLKPHATTVHALFYHGAGRGQRIQSIDAIKDALDSTASDMFPANANQALRFTTYSQNKTRQVKPENLLWNELVPNAFLRNTVVFVDESTQLTADIAALLLMSQPKRLVLTGDVSQQAAVGAGHPFQDWITLYNENPQRYGNQMAYVQLQQDHRATKELSAYTSKVRAGALPLDYVQSFDVDTDAQSRALLQREAAIVEAPTIDDTIRLTQSLIAHTIQEYPSAYHFKNLGDPIEQSGATLFWSNAVSPSLSVQTAIMPAAMVMAYTNADVSRLNQAVRATVRPLINAGRQAHQVPGLAPLVASGIDVGDMILQTENARQTLLYTTPQGHRKSSTTMNGEVYLLAAVHTWLPLANPQLSSTAHRQLWSLWTEAGLQTDVAALYTQGLHADPQSHLDLQHKLQQAAASTNHSVQKAALQLLRYGLTEMLCIEQDRLLSISKTHPVDGYTLEDKDLVRLVSPPTLERSKAPSDIEFQESFLRDVWRMDKGYPNSVPGKTGKADVPNYFSLSKELVRGLETLSLGHAYTVYKGQGSQAPIAISVVAPPKETEQDINHEASVYTGITRAEKGSYTLIHGTTAADINRVWAVHRATKDQMPSPVQLIANNELAPAPSSYSAMTPILPQHRNQPLEIATKVASPEALRYQAKVQWASHGVPPQLSTQNLAHLRPQILSASASVSMHPSPARISAPDMAAPLSQMALDTKKPEVTVWNAGTAPWVATANQQEAVVQALQQSDAPPLFD